MAMNRRPETVWGEAQPADDPKPGPKAIFTFKKLVIEDVEVQTGEHGQTYGEVLDQMIAERERSGDKLMTITLRLPPEPDWDI